MEKEQIREIIAKRVAMELKDGDVVNLGIGLPTAVPDYLPEGVQIFLQSENGLLGMGPTPAPGEEDPEFINAGGGFVTALEGASCFDSATSFGIIRGGHVNASVLGALQVDEKGDLANWIIPGKKAPGMGGAMDLLTGADKVILAMEHTAKGAPKILKKCTLPLTAKGSVNMIVTEMGVMEITPEGIVLTEINPEFTVEQVQAATEAHLIVSKDLKPMKNRPAMIKTGDKYRHEVTYTQEGVIAFAEITGDKTRSTSIRNSQPKPRSAVPSCTDSFRPPYSRRSSECSSRDRAPSISRRRCRSVHPSSPGRNIRPNSK